MNKTNCYDIYIYLNLTNTSKRNYYNTDIFTN